MKFKYLFSAILSSAVLFSGCQKEESVGSFDNIKLSDTYLTVSNDGGNAVLTVTATEDWQFVIDEKWPEVVSFNKDDKGNTIKAKHDRFGNLVNAESDIKSRVASWLRVDTMSGKAGETKVTFSVDASEAGREIEIALYAVNSGNKQYLRVRQGSMDAQPATCKEVIEGPDSKTYRVKGVCTSIANTQYGNWYLNDGTGEIYIYGTLDKNGAEKNFSSWNLEVGDEIEVEGPKMTFGTTVELVNVTVIKLVKSLIKVVSEPVVLPKEANEFEVKVAYKGSGVFPTISDEYKSWISIVDMNYVQGVPSKIEQNPADTAIVKVSVAPNAGGARGGEIIFSSAKGSSSSSVTYTFTQDGSIIDATAAEINAAEDGTTMYRISGYVSSIVNTKYGNLNIKDATGEVYVYGTNDFANTGIVEGDIVTVVGPKSSHKDAPQMVNVTLEKRVEVKDIEINNFRNLADDAETWYRISGTVGKSDEAGTKYDLETYGNFALTDETGSVYVYGVVPGWGGASKLFGTLGVKEGDVLTIVCHKASYKGLNQAGSAFYVSHKPAGEGGEPETPVGGDYEIKLPYVLGSSAYDDGIANINGTEDVKVLKIGTSKAAGSIAFTVPAGTKKLTYYAVAWKGAATTIEFYVGDTKIGEQAVAANDGATGNTPYTMTVADSDKYTLEHVFAAETEVKVTTANGAKTRAIFFGIKAE